MLTKEVRHLSLHYDGIRVDRARLLADNPSDAANDDAESISLLPHAQAIFEDTGYRVVLKCKQHLTLMEALEALVLSHGWDATDYGLASTDIACYTALHKEGNCQVLAFWEILEGQCDAPGLLANLGPPWQSHDGRLMGRIYQEVCQVLCLALQSNQCSVGFSPPN